MRHTVWRKEKERERKNGCEWEKRRKMHGTVADTQEVAVVRVLSVWESSLSSLDANQLSVAVLCCCCCCCCPNALSLLLLSFWLNFGINNLIKSCTTFSLSFSFSSVSLSPSLLSSVRIMMLLLLWLWLTWIKETICIPGHWKTRSSLCCCCFRTSRTEAQNFLQEYVVRSTFRPSVCFGKEFFQIFVSHELVSHTHTHTSIDLKWSEWKKGWERTESKKLLTRILLGTQSAFQAESELRLVSLFCPSILCTHTRWCLFFFTLFRNWNPLSRKVVVVSCILWWCVYLSLRSISSLLSIFSHASSPSLSLGSHQRLFLFFRHSSERHFVAVGWEIGRHFRTFTTRYSLFFSILSSLSLSLLLLTHTCLEKSKRVGKKSEKEVLLNSGQKLGSTFPTIRTDGVMVGRKEIPDLKHNIQRVW